MEVGNGLRKLNVNTLLYLFELQFTESIRAYIRLESKGKKERGKCNACFDAFVDVIDQFYCFGLLMMVLPILPFLHFSGNGIALLVGYS